MIPATQQIIDLLTHPSRDAIQLLGLQVALNDAYRPYTSPDEYRRREVEFHIEIQVTLSRLLERMGPIEVPGWRIEQGELAFIRYTCTEARGKYRVGYSVLSPDDSDIIDPVARDLIARGLITLEFDWFDWKTRMMDIQQERVNAVAQLIEESGLLNKDTVDIPALTRIIKQWTEAHPIENSIPD